MEVLNFVLKVTLYTKKDETVHEYVGNVFREMHFKIFGGEATAL